MSRTCAPWWQQARGWAERGGGSTVLFIDEIHRFNKAQQDALLPHVEDGVVTLIGATTENPYFEVNSALLSRLRVFRLEPLSDEEVGTIVDAGAGGRAAASPGAWRWRADAREHLRLHQRWRRACGAEHPRIGRLHGGRGCPDGWAAGVAEPR